MPALVAGIHVFSAGFANQTWKAGSSPAMTAGKIELALNPV
jgi:hypothetical protein